MLVYDRNTETVQSVETRPPAAHEVVWLRLLAPAAEEVIRVVGEMFKCHHLVVEDCIKHNQRPKLDSYHDHAMLAFFHLHEDLSTTELEIIMGSNFIITVAAEEVPYINELHSTFLDFPERMEHPGRILYYLLDNGVDEYLRVVDLLENEIETMEQAIYNNPHIAIGTKVFDLKRKLHRVRKLFSDERNVISAVTHQQFPYVREEANVYFMDVFDHLNRVIDSTDMFRESLTGLLDLQMSMKADRMNEIMKTLTIVSTFFLPLSFIAGLYGMNVKGVPEYNWEHGYAFVWGVILLVSGFMVWYFRRKKWI
ncbi:MAG: Magnesium transport protein CorA [Bacilli bacterium]|nr:Magnesium transport protein CorA [Bacilli bacterium]